MEIANNPVPVAAVLYEKLIFLTMTQLAEANLTFKGLCIM